MASITFAMDEELKPKIEKYSWINWSELAREELKWQDKKLDLLEKLEKEKEFDEWAVELGRRAKKGRWEEILSKLSPKEKEELLK